LHPTSVWICLPIAILISIVRPWCALIAVALLGAGLALLRPAVPPHPGDEPVRLVGRLARAPEWRGVGIYLDVELQTIDARPYRGRARLTEFLDEPEQRRLFEALDLGTGDRLEIVVKLRRPVVYDNPGVFDYRHHLERQGVFWTGTIRNPRLITVLDRRWHARDRIKNWIHARLERPFSTDPEVRGLVMGMVLGRKYGLTANSERQFQAGGLYHLVVVSGFNLAVVAGSAMWLARWILWNRRTRLIFVLACTLAYAAIVEGQTPVFRATLMVCFLIAGKLLDRGHSLLNATSGTAFILLLIDPSAIEDSSFQMTFAAVFAVAAIGIPAGHWMLGWLREGLKEFDNPSKDGTLSLRAADWRVSRRVWCERHGLPSLCVRVPWTVLLIAGETIIVSIAVEMIFVLFMVESFHRLSPISPLLNVPAGLITAAVTPLGLLLMFLPGPAAAFVGAIIGGLLQALLGIVDFGLRLPGATVRVPSPPGWLWILYGLTVTLLVLAIGKRRLRISIGCVVAALAIQGVICLADFSPLPPRDATLTFLDVGQGDSTLVELPSGERILIDGGGIAAGRFLDLRDESTFSIGENVVSPYLFSRGIRRLDSVVLTHAHHDHMDGLFSVLENFEIGEFWLGRNPMIPRYRDLIHRIQEKQIPIRWVAAGHKIGPFSVLHPPANWIPRRTTQNNDSVVLLLNTGGPTALLTGDIESRIPVPETVDVLKVPHHGSRGARLQTRAAIRVISVGANNSFGHPHESSLPALRTDRLGAITITLASPRPHVEALTKPCPSCKLAFLLGATTHKDLKNLRVSGF
jgi:competence protein ComEC